MDKRNKEGYSDPTAYEALSAVEREEKEKKFLLYCGRCPARGKTCLSPRAYCHDRVLRRINKERRRERGE